MTKPHVIVYSRPGCHLCDEAKLAIAQSGLRDRFTFEEVNIESDHALLTKYKYEIPVVMLDGAEIFRHRVNTEEFNRLIQVKL